MEWFVPKRGVVVGNDGSQGLLLFVGVLFVVFLFLGQVFLNLPDIRADIDRWGEDGRDIERDEFGIGHLPAGLHGLEQKVVDGVAGLAVQVLAVHDEEALFYAQVGLQQRGGFEARERLAATGGVPDVAVAEVLFDALDDVLDGVDLVRPLV